MLVTIFNCLAILISIIKSFAKIFINNGELSYYVIVELLSVFLVLFRR
jgi:hypothetical protein